MESHTPPAVIHVDLDGASAIYTMHGWKYPYDTDPLFETGITSLLTLLDEFGIRATLFVIASDLDNPVKQALLKKAVAHGHEIACHSYTHRKLTSLSDEEQLNEISASREYISRVLDVPVDGFRAPYFDVNADTILRIAEAGYKYDSSLFPGKIIADGSRHVETGQKPARVWEDHALIEFPLPAYSPLPFPFHASYSLVLGTWYFRLGMHRYRQTNMPLVLLFHLTDLAAPLPSERTANWQKKFFTLSYLDQLQKRKRCARMLSHVVEKYRVVETSVLLEEVQSGNYT
jgi:hypothetical protein